MAWLAEFADSIRAEGRRSVIDVGAGPATDAPAFLDAGVEYVGIDLAVANGVLANESGATVVAASLFDLPFPDVVLRFGVVDEHADARPDQRGRRARCVPSAGCWFPGRR